MTIFVRTRYAVTLRETSISITTVAGAALSLALAAAPMAANAAGPESPDRREPRREPEGARAAVRRRSAIRSHDVRTDAGADQASTSALFDAGIVLIDVMKNDAARAKFANEQDTIARAGSASRSRAARQSRTCPRPTLSKTALLKASSVSFLPASAAGLGIADEMKAKTKAAAALLTSRTQSRTARPSSAFS
jgi:hypothetical protein